MGSWFADGRPRTYTPTATKVAEARIAEAVETALGAAREPLTGALRIEVTVWRPIPTSVPVRTRATGMPTQRPDLDNHAKLFIHALTPSKPGDFGVWLDDSQIVDMTVRKRYALDRPPRWHLGRRGARCRPRRPYSPRCVSPGGGAPRSAPPVAQRRPSRAPLFQI